MSKGKAVVVLSGGQDSTTCLFLAKQVGYDEIHAVTFNYNQRHKIELEAAAKVASMAGVTSHEIIDLGPVLKGKSPLVNASEEVGHYKTVSSLPGGVEPTFVPGRNALFLVIAANRAALHGATTIYTGVCEEDFGGYWDCRQKFIDSMQNTINEALFGKATEPHHTQLPSNYESPLITIVTPLMNLNKQNTVRMAKGLAGCWDALAYTHTCYDGQYPPNPRNHASLLRAKGFREAGYADPLIERAICEGLLPVDYPKDGLVEQHS